MLKRCYKLYPLILSDKLKREEVLNELGISFEEIEKNAKEYSYSIDASGKDWKKVSKKQINRVYVCQLFGNELSLDEVKAILDRFDIDNKCLIQIRYNMRSYMASLVRNKLIASCDAEMVEKNISDNIKKGMDYYKSISAKKSATKDTFDPCVVVSGYLASDFQTLRDYCVANGITNHFYERTVNEIKIVSPELDAQYKKKDADGKEKEYKILCGYLYDIMVAIKNDDFDILDYYEKYGKIDYKMREASRIFYTKEEKARFACIVGDYHITDNQGLYYRKYLNAELVLNGRPITREENEFVLNKLVEVGAPIDEIMFINGVRKYILKEKIKAKKRRM